MALRSVYCTVATRGRVDCILIDLRDDGFPTSAISILFVDPCTSPQASDPALEAHTSTGAIRGVIASLDGIQRIVVPGLGPIVATGVIAGSLSPGTCSGAILGMMQQFGVPEAEATRYAARVVAGAFFIAVQTPHSGPGDRAREIFAAGKADDICTKLDVARTSISPLRGPVARSAWTAA